MGRDFTAHAAKWRLNAKNAFALRKAQQQIRKLPNVGAPENKAACNSIS